MRRIFAFARRVQLPGLALLVLVVGGAFILGVLRSTPAFTGEKRVPVVTGGSHPSNPTAMYDEGHYLLQVAHGYLSADDPGPAARTGTGEAAPPDYVATARRTVEQSLRLDPANAYAWQVYAEALLAEGQPAAARAALINSWRLAPNMPNLALSRASLILTLYDALPEAARAASWDGDVREILERDAAVLKHHVGIEIVLPGDAEPE